MILDDVLALPQSGVIILTRDNSVLINYSISMGANLETLYNDFRGVPGITLQVMSANADLETLKLHTEFYRAHYLKLGYRLMVAPMRKSISYRVRAVPSPDLKAIDVELVTARGDSSKVVGRFKTVREAKDYIETYYGTDNPFCLPVYAVNADTKAFLARGQTKLLEIKE